MRQAKDIFLLTIFTNRDIHSFDKDRSLILIDELDPKDNLVLDFDSYSQAIVKIVRNSNPKFSIGIYGEWGTGKTTLMKHIRNSLDEDKNIVTVWFNPWRYEREYTYGITALLKTIALELDKTKHFLELKPLLLRGAMLLGKEILNQFASQFIAHNGLDDYERKLLPKLEKLNTIDRDTIYFDGIRQISEKFKEIRKNNRANRIVIFIDDLDRCSPKKVLELFESKSFQIWKDLSI